MNLTPDQALKEIRQKKIYPLYFIHGNEPYYIDKLAEALEKAVVPESEKSFNQFVSGDIQHALFRDWPDQF